MANNFRDFPGYHKHATPSELARLERLRTRIEYLVDQLKEVRYYRQRLADRIRVRGEARERRERRRG